MRKRNLSYRQLAEGGLAKVKELAEADRLDELDEATLARCAHFGRFFGRVGNAVPGNLRVGDVLSEDELQRIWEETADPDADVGRCPLIH